MKPGAVSDRIARYSSVGRIGANIYGASVSLYKLLIGFG